MEEEGTVEAPGYNKKYSWSKPTKGSHKGTKVRLQITDDDDDDVRVCFSGQ